MSNAIFIFALFAFVFSVSEGQRCSTYGHSNGCSVPLGLPYFFKDIFKPDCDRHDICYGCGDMYGITRKRCDDVFLKDLIRRCNIDARVKQDDFCENVARTSYYTLVRWFGKTHYDAPSPDWCRQSWVTRCFLYSK